MHQISTKRVDKTWWGKWFTGNCTRKWNLTILLNDISTNQNLSRWMGYKIPWDFEKKTDPLIPTRRPDLVIINKNKSIYIYIYIYIYIICRIVDFVVPTDRRGKIKENEKRNKYLDLAREWKYIGNRKEIMILIIAAWGTIPKGLERELEELEIGRRTETIQTTALLSSASILRRVL